MNTSDSTTKQCFLCKQEFPRTREYFVSNKGKKDGMENCCHACNRKKVKAYKEADPERYKEQHHAEYERNREKYAVAARRYFETHRDVNRASVAKYHEANPEKKNAHIVVRHAVKRGVLPHISERTCEHCGNPAQEYHHWSYEPEHLLDVIPLCRRCHKKAHAK